MRTKREYINKFVIGILNKQTNTVFQIFVTVKFDNFFCIFKAKI